MTQAADVVAPPSPAEIRPPRAAATLVVVRAAAVGAEGGIEVLLSRRAERGDHNSGAWVFPGGIVDPGDRASHACCAGLDDAAASTRLGLAEGGLDYYVAAVRECFEESGLLYAIDRDGAMVRLDHDVGDDRGARLAAWRGPLHRGERTVGELCQTFGLSLALDRLVYLSHWLTPPARAKRFDTRFFIAEAPPSQTAAFDGTEMVEQLWLRPADALARAHELKLMTPTQKTLETIDRFASVAALLEWARSPREVGLIMPRVGSGSRGMRPVIPEEPAYAELGRLDPQGLGTASYELQPRVAVRLSPRLIRVTANNGSMMTGPGTNTYLVGGGAANEWAVIDPGPPMDEHVQAILAAAPGAIRWIFVTHTHKDHSPAAQALKRHTGAPLLGMAPLHAEWQDTDFVPDQPLRGGEVFQLPGPPGAAGHFDSSTLRVIHTPGHAGNHLCYLLEQEHMLFTGDHVMQGSTVVINPPDGDMGAYLRSLNELKELALDWLAPGHGFLMDQPRQAMQRIVEHRLKREAKVLAAAPEVGAASTDTLLASVYADVPPHLHTMARRSLLAHLLKLRDDRQVAEAPPGTWMRVPLQP